uniref:Cytochrome c-type biogenesis protein CcmE n=1 Tax=Rhizophora mucronata TaxID=61149 RepID=A0A2P2QLS6_RHIMU
MASRFALFRLRSHLLRASAAAATPTTTTTRLFPSNPFIFSTTILSPLPDLRTLSTDISSLSGIRFFSTVRRQPIRPKTVDIGKRARQLQARRLWSYGIAFSCAAVFVIIVLSNFEDQVTFYVTPTEAMENYKTNPEKTMYRLGGLVLEGSIAYPMSSTEMEFVITDLATDILVRYEGPLPDLFREGHSAVVEGFVKPLTEDVKNDVEPRSVAEKARSRDCYFSATRVLAKHDEKYMPEEVAVAIEKNKKLIKGGELGQHGADIK